MKKSIFAFVAFFINSFCFGNLIYFPENEVKKILLMKSDEIIAFSTFKEIELFKFKDPIPTESNDKVSSLLDKIPEVDKNKFKSFQEIFEGSTLGVYFSKHNSSLNLINDTVIFSDQADRWTVAHELGHALIDKNRPDEQKKDEALDFDRLRNAKEDYEEIMSIYRNLGFFPNETYMDRALDSIKTWSNLMLNLLYTYELEEVRIEKFLTRLYENEPELNLDTHTYKRSFWYVEKNCTAAISKLNNARDVLDHFEKITTEEFKIKNSFSIKQLKSNISEKEKVINSLCS